jgi:hypothetical protein
LAGFGPPFAMRIPLRIWLGFLFLALAFILQWRKIK